MPPRQARGLSTGWDPALGGNRQPGAAVPPGDPRTPTEYERVRRAIVAKYNSLLADTRSRLLAAIQRVEQGWVDADTDKLTQKILELVDYLDHARL
jgi:hypothetical protein